MIKSCHGRVLNRLRRKIYAGMAELADAIDLGSIVNDVGVRVSLPAPKMKKGLLLNAAALLKNK